MEPIVSLPQTSVVRETTVPWPVFAPIETGGSHEVVVHPTERRHVVDSGPSRSLSSLRATPVPARESGWGEAVDLTRQAMAAWLGVLVRTGPVEVTAR
jgi:hypothetical protein